MCSHILLLNAENKRSIAKYLTHDDTIYRHASHIQGYDAVRQQYPSAFGKRRDQSACSSRRIVVNQQLTKLESFDTKALLAMWPNYFTQKPKRSRREYLAASIAYKMQEKAYGGLPPTIRNKLHRLAFENQQTSQPKYKLLVPDRNQYIAHAINKKDQIEVIFNITFRSYAGKKIAYNPNGQAISLQKTNHDDSLVQAITRSFRWNHMLDSGEAKSVKEIAETEKVERTYVGDVMRLKYLAPEIVTMIMHGAQPRTLNVSQLIRQPIPLCWQQQKQLLNFA
jgi:hypothetical protein